MILLTGGTGFVGQEVVRALLTLGQPIRLLVRHPDRAGSGVHPDVEVIRGDLLDPKTLPAACQGIETIIHLVGIIKETGQVSFQQAHVEATDHLLRAARAAGVKRFLHMSALGTRPEARSEYHRTKWAAEELVRSSGLDWTIFRPSLIYGYDRQDRLVNLLHRLVTPPGSWLSLQVFPLLNGGSMQVQPVSVRQVARAFAQAVVKPESIGQTYALTGPVPVTFRYLVEKVIRVTGQKSLYETWPVRVFCRGLAAALLFGGLVLNGFTHFSSGIYLGLSLLLIGSILLPKKIVLFALSTNWLWPLAHLLDRFAPRWARFKPQLLMLEEDNQGDPRPASEMFGLEPETLEQALVKLFDT